MDHAVVRDGRDLVQPLAVAAKRDRADLELPLTAE